MMQGVGGYGLGPIGARVPPHLLAGCIYSVDHVRGGRRLYVCQVADQEPMSLVQRNRLRLMRVPAQGVYHCRVSGHNCLVSFSQQALFTYLDLPHGQMSRA